MDRALIPFNRPAPVGREAEYVAEALTSGHVSGDGAFTKRCQAYLERRLGSGRVLLTTSCTHALDMSAMLLDLGPGDEVIVPSFTFVSGVNAFVLRGARPVFADVRSDTLNIDETRLEALITPRTRAIALVHYAGVACEMNAIMEIARRHGLTVIEDNAHGLFGSYHGTNLGTMGALATLSFHETKNVSCGEGGALIINDEALAERAEIIREKGTDRSRFFRGQVDKYSWVDLGSSYLPSDILAAVLLAQLEQSDSSQARRRHIWDAYASELKDWAASQDVRLPIVPEHAEQPYHLFYLLLPTLDDRQRFIAHMRERGVQSVFHYLPLHLSVMGQRWGGRQADCPVTELVSDTLVRLPLYASLEDVELERVLESVREFRVASISGATR